MPNGSSSSHLGATLQFVPERLVTEDADSCRKVLNLQLGRRKHIKYIILTDTCCLFSEGRFCPKSTPVPLAENPIPTASQQTSGHLRGRGRSPAPSCLQCWAGQNSCLHPGAYDGHCEIAILLSLNIIPASRYTHAVQMLLSLPLALSFFRQGYGQGEVPFLSLSLSLSPSLPLLSSNYFTLPEFPIMQLSWDSSIAPPPKTPLPTSLSSSYPWISSQSTFGETAGKCSPYLCSFVV